ncbi:MAG: DUF3786 domain-containing protein [Thermodesulfobacteriota bacterium]|nr:DUF3786 domain-containing protein [Thermodesulfobacteriota bacterium]
MDICRVELYHEQEAGTGGDVDSESSVFKKIYQDYLEQISHLDLSAVAKSIGVESRGDSVIVPLFGKPYRIHKRGIASPQEGDTSHSVKVVLCKYLLLHPKRELEDISWVSFKDFRDAAPFVDAFRNNAEMVIARNFAGRVDLLEDSCLRLGGYNPGMELSYNVILQFDALPRLPILLLFNDEDDEFSADCRLLFERQAADYLDMECLAILAWLLADYLTQLSDNMPCEKA